ncbi:hypothetical protein F383_37184 [Gossypium arboreum]|uniref:Uncharacterized protein n=1 Tax=Gossypium arboreum TaxID=29729 RepID=A0A0B0MED5_GOSAR|nr:hypothetical protein F383_37184 [Gossypium arboreum]
MEQMDQHGKSTWPGLPHISKPHGRVHFPRSKHDLHG